MEHGSDCTGYLNLRCFECVFFGVLNHHSNFYKLNLFQTISFKISTNGTHDVLMWAEPTLCGALAEGTKSVDSDRCILRTPPLFPHPSIPVPDAVTPEAPNTSAPPAIPKGRRTTDPPHEMPFTVLEMPGFSPLAPWASFRCEMDLHLLIQCLDVHSSLAPPMSWWPVCVCPPSH